jgi:hypothetical protein
MEIMMAKISDIKPNAENPRVIKDDKFKKLVKSIQDFPEMLSVRPIVVNESWTVLGGNMRLRACIEAGLKEVPIIEVTSFTPEQEREFVIKDNSSFGEWDWDVLANEWDALPLEDWGLQTFKVDFQPNVMPSIDNSEVTSQEIEKKAIELANQMVNAQRVTEVICPNCAHEFSI